MLVLLVGIAGWITLSVSLWQSGPAAQAQVRRDVPEDLDEADDALVLDTSGMSIEEVVASLVAALEEATAG